MSEHRILRVTIPPITGEDVATVQRFLNTTGEELKADGVYGAKTANAVARWQEVHGLKPDGIVGPLTWAVLDKAIQPQQDTTMRDELITRVLANAAALLGTKYSQDDRIDIWPGGSMDCSSFTAAIWAAAGYPLLSAAGDELRTSYREVDAAGFDLVWPASRALIGKGLPSPKGLLLNYGAQAGDIVFWSFGTTTRANRITHVGSIDAGALNIIHTANVRENCCRKPLTYGDGHICAIIRLRADIVLPTLPVIAIPSEDSTRADEWAVRALQVALNIQHGTKLVCDGLMGSNTAAAVSTLNNKLGKPGTVCTADTWAALGFKNPVQA